MLDERAEGLRSGVDCFHFAMAFAGFCFAVSGAVLSSPCIGCCGLLALAWGLVYFAANNEDV